MDTNSPQFQYVNGQVREHFGALFALFEEQNALALARPGWRLDVAYGPHPREVMDLLPAGADALGTVVYFHAGYWQSRDKSQFRFLAPAFQTLGWNTALVNYPLCPEVTVAQIVDSARRALVHLCQRPQDSACAGPLVLCGHSAGAHLAIELALQQAGGQIDAPVAGVVAISGVYDLQPLIGTTLNERLQLDAASALANSPTTRVPAGAAPALFVWGAAETRAFHEQSQGMARLWQQPGNRAECLAVDATDHFSVLEHVMRPDGPLASMLDRWSGRSAER